MLRDVFAQGDGSLTILSAGQVTRWLPQGKDRFVEKSSGIPLAVVRDRQDRVARIASAALYPVAVFERAPPLTDVLPPIAAFGFATILLALFVRLASRLLHRFVPAYAGSRFAASANPASLANRWARRGYWTIIVAIVAWALFGLALAIDFKVLFVMPFAVRLLLGTLALLTAPAALAQMWGAWRDTDRHWLSRGWSWLVALASGALAWTVYVLDLINFSANW
ncbi:hypothetical protein [Dyella sp.]|uniref:hypothetical protein n=1 Tax=Dyella sp. TaxID=1869338 RepID=UPI002D79BCDD|nr:hypothetical protein [Dyella sp.]HET6431274.1 hypothetical protein [Dyella sp.]